MPFSRTFQGLYEPCKLHFYYAAYDLNTIVQGEGFLKVTGSHIHWKSDMSETVLDRDTDTTGHFRK